MESFKRLTKHLLRSAVKTSLRSFILPVLGEIMIYYLTRKMDSAAEEQDADTWRSDDGGDNWTA